MKKIALALLILGGLGCAAPEAGKATSPVDARMTVHTLTLPALPDTPTGAGASYIVTISQTVTITPTSSATQTAETSVDAKAEIPAGVLPK